MSVDQTEQKFVFVNFKEKLGDYTPVQASYGHMRIELFIGFGFKRGCAPEAPQIWLSDPTVSRVGATDGLPFWGVDPA